VAVAEEITSPELILVSPPDLAAQAREALPNYEVEYEQWVVWVRAAFAATAAEQKRRERRLAVGAWTFTILGAVNCIAPLVLLVLDR
jgi:hypothetical protein